MNPETLNKLIASGGSAAELAQVGKYAEAADLLMKMGVRGDYWRACRAAAGLPYDDATNDRLCAELVAQRKARFKK